MIRREAAALFCQTFGTVCSWFLRYWPIWFNDNDDDDWSSVDRLIVARVQMFQLCQVCVCVLILMNEFIMVIDVFNLFLSASDRRQNVSGKEFHRRHHQHREVSCGRGYAEPHPVSALDPHIDVVLFFSFFLFQQRHRPV